MKRIKIELWSLGVAAAVMALLAGSQPGHESLNSRYLSADRARAEVAGYLEAEPRYAHLNTAAHRWSVSDGQSVAWLDARSGELLEVEFAP
ncbi:MAG: hypothetical protein AAGF11_50475 [Myxococcota bacterium]